MDEFLVQHPDMINLPKDVLKIRFNNVDQYRRKLIKEVIDQRSKIIEENKKSNQSIKQTLEFMSEIDLEAVYNRKLDVIEDNYQRVQKFAVFEDWFFNEYGELLDEC
jgi:hypothetical protein